MPLRGLLSKVHSRLRGKRPRPAVLMYHRVASVDLDPWKLAVTPEHFEEQVAYLRRHRTPLSMEDLVQGVRTKTLPEDAVAVTFDDGYRDNLVHAKPILESHKVPATVFVATGFTGLTSGFWWDELAAMILASPHPADYRQVVGGHTITLNWESAEPYDAPGAWHGLEEPRTARQRCFLTIWRSLKYTSFEEREAVMNSLRQVFEIRRDFLAEPMTYEDIRTLQSDGLLTIAAHTVTHPALSSLPGEERRKEIEESRRQCLALSDHAVNGFAYPYGDVNAAVRNDVAALGLSWACSTESGFVHAGSDPYALPRMMVSGSSLSSFIEQLQG